MQKPDNSIYLSCRPSVIRTEFLHETPHSTDRSYNLQDNRAEVVDDTKGVG